MYQILSFFVATTTFLRKQNTIAPCLIIRRWENVLVVLFYRKSVNINLIHCNKNIKIFIFNMTFLLTWKMFDRKTIVNARLRCASRNCRALSRFELASYAMPKHYTGSMKVAFSRHAMKFVRLECFNLKTIPVPSLLTVFFYLDEAPRRRDHPNIIRF